MQRRVSLTRLRVPPSCSVEIYSLVGDKMCSVFRLYFIEWPAYLWDRFWFFYWWYVALISAVCITVTLGTVLLWALGLRQP